MSHVRLALLKGLGRHLRAGHPWVFRKAIQSAPKIPPGSVVDLTEEGKFIARGYYDPLSPIAVRILTLDPTEVIDAAFFQRRIQRAYQARKELLDLSGTDSFRIVHGEGDGLPGVVVDKYADYCVLKLYSAGLNPYRSLILEALKGAIPKLEGIIGRDEVGRDDADDDGQGAGKVLHGSAPDRLRISENGASFWVDPFRGQKTGFFLDQRDNRHLIRRLSKGRRVLNCFGYTGGFSVNAALGGAKQVFTVDSDQSAIALAKANFELNALRPHDHDFLAADVFDLLASFKQEGRKFDLVILDPPAFAKSQKAVEGALEGYRSLNRQALSVLEPGGLLATSSCSARVSAEDFFDAIKEAGFKASCQLALIEERYQPPDHPIRMQFKEGRYLKFYVLKKIEEKDAF